MVRSKGHRPGLVLVEPLGLLPVGASVPPSGPPLLPEPIVSDRILIVGDVHGCLDELDELVDVLAPTACDRLFFLGDLVDRGPDSVGVVRRVRALVDAHPGSLAVAGNHEEKALRLRRQGRPGHPWTSEMDAADWQFVESMPLFHRLPEVGALLLHGGLYPRFFETDGGLGEPPPKWHQGGGGRMNHLRRVLRVRNVDSSGAFSAGDGQGTDLVHWTEVYDGREGFCFFGHDPQLSRLGPLRAPHTTGLDTGCCFGGRLSSAVLSRGVDPARAEIVSVPARARYADPRSAHADD